MKQIIATFGLLVFFSLSANAGITSYSVSDAAGNCGPANGAGGHGLWTRNLVNIDIDCAQSSANVGNYFSIQSGELLVDSDAGVGFLTFLADNSAGDTAQAFIQLSGLVDGANWGGSIKNPFSANVNDWDIFTTIQGVIQISGANVNDVFNVSTVSDYGFQMGLGANDKNTGLGASSWLTVMNGQGVVPSSSWDINLNITPVPAPATLMLLGLGLMGLSRIRQHNR